MVGPCNLSLKSTTIKFLCSYGGKILPRYPDGKLRYQGGETRVLAVDRSISFSELLVKLGEMCGTTVLNLRCQLPTEDLDALISITSDEDLANLIEEYDRAAGGITSSSSTTPHKIRAFLSNPNKKLSPTSSIASNISQTTSSPVSTPVSSPALMIKNTSSGSGGGSVCRRPKVVLPPPTNRCIHQMSNTQLPVMKLIPPQPFYYNNNNSYGKAVASAGRFPHQYAYYTTTVHNGNHWQ